MQMHKNHIKLFLYTLLLLAGVSFQCCTNQETLAPQQKGQATENNDVLQKIKSLGFAESQIKETPDYYLADGDLYFPKEVSHKTITPANKSGHRILEKYATLTIHVDESLAGVMDEHWRAGIDQAIADWNADEHVHFHFALTNSTTANINVVKDTDLPQDLAIASEFPRDGRTGSSIRINITATKAVEDPKQAFAHALEHCVGFLHSTSVKNKDVTLSSNALASARGPRFDIELYAIQGDMLYRIDGQTGEYYPLRAGWAETEVMGEIDGKLYMVQFGTLYAVNPSTGGNYAPLTNGWEGSQYITSIPGGKLYIMQDSWIWPVDPDTGMWGDDLGYYHLPRGIVGYYDEYGDGRWKLGVLRRNPSGFGVSILYQLKLSNGHVYSSNTIPASGMDDWNGKYFLTANKRLNIFNGTENWVDTGGRYGNYPHVELVAPYHPSYVYYISDGTLYKRVINQAYWVNQLGDYHAWDDTSCMVYLQ